MGRKPYTDRAIDRYLDKNAKQALITATPVADLALIITIPAYKEPDIIPLLHNLYHCNPPSCGVEVLVGINQPETAPAHVIAAHRTQANAINHWAQHHQRVQWQAHALHLPPLPTKHAGVGLARKLLMDEALHRFHQTANGQGVIVCLDADCRVDNNYLEALYALFHHHPRTSACTIYFEHPLDDADLATKNTDRRCHRETISSAGAADSRTDTDAQGGANAVTRIARYEAFLRYYRLGLHYAGSAHAFHSVGSSMAVRACAYARQGGMNRRQAGEDFYFIQKLIDGEHVVTLDTTRVIPSARESDRVPFGTGRAMGNSRHDSDAIPFYAPQVFDELRAFFTALPRWYADPNILTQTHFQAPMRAFLDAQRATTHLLEIKHNVASVDAFVRRAKRWFNGFLCMKYARFACPAYYPYAQPIDAVTTLLHAAALAPPAPLISRVGSSYIDLLRVLRTIDKNTNNPGWF